MNEQRRVETIDQFKLRIATVIRGKPEQINGAPRPDPLLVRQNKRVDSWTATSINNAPSAGYYHTAVWTGSEMIVWGGAGVSGRLNTGGRYNPGTDTGTATTHFAPSARFGHTAVLTDSEMLAWGGGDGTNYLNTGGRYCAQVATPTPQRPAARRQLLL